MAEYCFINITINIKSITQILEYFKGLKMWDDILGPDNVGMDTSYTVLAVAMQSFLGDRKFRTNRRAAQLDRSTMLGIHRKALQTGMQSRRDIPREEHDAHHTGTDG